MISRSEGVLQDLKIPTVTDIEPCLEEQGLKNHRNQNTGYYFLQHFLLKARDTTSWFDTFCFGSVQHRKKEKYSNICWHMNHTLLRKYMFKAFYLHFSNIQMCLQPCGADMIRRSGTKSNAMIWGRWGR